MQFDPATGLIGVPTLDSLGDDGGDLGAVLIDEMTRRPFHPTVHLVPDAGVVT
ncbi:Uncharacterised protein [Mycobacteroides abscessus subsp. abscessus]|nr:Uncharacterised protein [Mycobacteroides abscessus subsp. abscessus]